MLPFKYSPLLFPSTTLRLVKLQAGSLESNDIDIELVEVNHVNIIHEAPAPDENLAREAYEAVSWCWGKDKWNKHIRIHQGEQVFYFSISPNLYQALKAFRKEDRVRTLWVDAISIDQNNTNEKNHQVPMMSQIYGSASSVLIWLGDGDEKSRLALDFIKNDVLRLWEFDKLCDDTSTAPKWDALIALMKRPWFSRRWVVQEIVLANEAVLQVGMDTISWQEFADAVSLFVEVETATHRLSEVMKKDPAFYHIPDFFGDVRRLGATLLVEATSNVYRRTKHGRREFLLSLEHLVSSLSVFDATEPRDTIFALLAIASDTQPQAAGEGRAPKTSVGQQRITALAQSRFIIQPYSVDYKRPFLEICKDFVHFSIRKSDRANALDILCRPWAPQVKSTNNEAFEKLPSWIPDLKGAAFAMYEHATAGQRMHRKNADPLVGMPSSGQRVYQAAGSRAVDFKVLKFKKRQEYYSMFVSGFVLDKIGTAGEASRGGYIPHQWLTPGGWEDPRTKPPPDEFWRTLVADRGSYGRNAPTFYTRACDECFKRMIPGEPLNTKELIDEGRCTIVAEFLRRVQAVVWNRQMLRTEKMRLALVDQAAQKGDLICIFYGCSVPVVLRKVTMSVCQMSAEEAEDQEVLAKSQKEAVAKIETAYLERRDRRKAKLMQNKSRTATVVERGKRIWGISKSLTVVLFALYIRLWEHARLESVLLLIFTACAILLVGFPAVLDGGVVRTWSWTKACWLRVTKKKIKVPIIVQSRDDFHYQIVGPCYVHGMMNGEAISLSTKPQTFELR